MMKGGIFIYPKTSDKPNGQLRPIYECNPIALIAKFAGSKVLTEKLLFLKKNLNQFTKGLLLLQDQLKWLTNF